MVLAFNVGMHKVQHREAELSILGCPLEAGGSFEKCAHATVIGVQQWAHQEMRMC